MHWIQINGVLFEVLPVHCIALHWPWGWTRTVAKRQNATANALRRRFNNDFYISSHENDKQKTFYHLAVTSFDSLESKLKSKWMKSNRFAMNWLCGEKKTTNWHRQRKYWIERKSRAAIGIESKMQCTNGIPFSSIIENDNWIFIWNMSIVQTRRVNEESITESNWISAKWMKKSMCETERAPSCKCKNRNQVNKPRNRWKLSRNYVINLPVLSVIGDNERKLCVLMMCSLTQSNWANLIGCAFLKKMEEKINCWR